jgi:TRAP-type C4-dicarboxylate transport system permease small subunit
MGLGANLMRQILRGISYFENFIGVIGLCIMALSTFTSVVMRYVFKFPLAQVEDISIFSMTWVISIGAAMASRDNEHIKSDFLSSFTKNRKAICIVGLLLDLAALAIIIIVAKWFGLFAKRSFLFGETSGPTGIPIVVPKISLLVGAILMAVHQLGWIGKRIGELIKECRSGG